MAWAWQLRDVLEPLPERWWYMPQDNDAVARRCAAYESKRHLVVRSAASKLHVANAHHTLVDWEVWSGSFMLLALALIQEKLSSVAFGRQDRVCC